MRWSAAAAGHRFTVMKGADVNTTGSNASSDGHRRPNRFMTVMLPVLLAVYVAIPLAAAHK
jgi:hypothetical protein